MVVFLSIDLKTDLDMGLNQFIDGSARDRRREYNRCRQVSKLRESVGHGLQMAHIRDGDFQDKTFLAGASMTFNHFGHPLGDLCDTIHDSRVGADPEKGKDWPSDSAHPNHCPVAFDHTGVFQAPDAFGGGRRRQSDSSPQLRHRKAGVALQFDENAPVHPIDETFDIETVRSQMNLLL
jgi:hypothetical protein